MGDPHIILIGDPFNGFTVYGPFPTKIDALEAVGNYDGDWWVERLQDWNLREDD